MSVQNELAAKAIGEIIAEGMSISDFDITDKVKSEAVSALDEIRLIMHKNSKSEKKIEQIEMVMEKYRIKQ